MIKKIKPGYILVLLITVLTASCEYGRKAEEQLNKFNSQAEELEVMVNGEIEKLTDLDSILPETSKRLKEADSIINDASSTLDSLNQRLNKIKNVFN